LLVNELDGLFHKNKVFVHLFYKRKAGFSMHFGKLAELAFELV